MPDVTRERAGVPMYGPAGPRVATAQDAMDLN